MILGRGVACNTRCSGSGKHLERGGAHSWWGGCGCPVPSSSAIAPTWRRSSPPLSSGTASHSPRQSSSPESGPLAPPQLQGLVALAVGSGRRHSQASSPCCRQRRRTLTQTGHRIPPDGGTPSAGPPEEERGRHVFPLQRVMKKQTLLSRRVQPDLATASAMRCTNSVRLPNGCHCTR